MKVHQSIILAWTLAAASSLVVAHEHGGDKGLLHDDGREAYAVESDGDIIVDGDGDCIRIGGWSESTMLGECEGMVMAEKAPEPMPEPEPEEIVEAIPEVDVPAPAPAPAPVVATPARPSSFSIIHFDFDEDDMDSASSVSKTPMLNDLVSYMKAVPGSRVSLVGHTDSSGPAEYNQQLSERRANDVAQYLTGQGIAANRIVTSGRGENEPKATNDTREGRSENRRVEVEIIN